MDDTDRENWSTQRKICASVASSTTDWSELFLEKNNRSGEHVLERLSCKSRLDTFYPAQTELSLAAPFQQYKAITKYQMEFCPHLLLYYI
jgi:hypothetical protein